MERSAEQHILSIRGIGKTFPGVRALSSVKLNIGRGSIHALLGENGAGKSTLVRIVTGGYLPDEGTMSFDGRPYSPRTPHDAIAAGIRVVHQELNLLPYLSVAENIFLDSLPRRGPFLDIRRLHESALALLKRVGLDVDPASQVERLGVAQMQLVEIARALSQSCKLLILDEPTASLSAKDAERLFQILRDLQKDGLSVIYISHHLSEIFKIADTLSVLRNGSMVLTRPVSAMDLPQIVSAMVGRQMDSEYPFLEGSPVTEQPILEVRGLRFRGNPHSLSFVLKKGEILGISGLVGSLRTEAMRALFGADPKEAGEILLDGTEVRISSPSDAVRSGICLLTEDRKEQGLVLDLPVVQNVSLASLQKVSHSGILDFGEERHRAEEFCESLSIRTPSVEQLVRNLSGGNQQKVVLAKWLLRDARVLIFDEPTRGIDVGAKYEIYLLLWRLLAEGKGILVVSSDLSELMGICHRILVFSDGEIVAEVPRKAFDQEKILSFAYKNYLR